MYPNADAVLRLNRIIMQWQPVPDGPKNVQSYNPTRGDPKSTRRSQPNTRRPPRLPPQTTQERIPGMETNHGPTHLHIQHDRNLAKKHTKQRQTTDRNARRASKREESPHRKCKNKSNSGIQTLGACMPGAQTPRLTHMNWKQTPVATSNFKDRIISTLSSYNQHNHIMSSNSLFVLCGMNI